MIFTLSSWHILFPSLIIFCDWVHKEMERISIGLNEPSAYNDNTHVCNENHKNQGSKSKWNPYQQVANQILLLSN